jgi:pyruvate/2-oxoglutarate dehydrogenase complex dihydrolipoamide dehydrogenase (E3) component
MDRRILHNIACMPSKKVIQGTKVASLFARAAEFGIETGPFAINMEGVRERKRKMVDLNVKGQLAIYKKSGTNLILGQGRMIGPRTLEVKTREGSTRRLIGDRLFFVSGDSRHHSGHPRTGVSQAADAC